MGERPEERYEALVRTHAADLYRCAYRLTGARATAEDLVQETFSEAWRRLETLRCSQAARAWLFAILRHRHAHLVRGASRRPTVASGIDELAGVARDEANGLQRALDQLDERVKVPLLMVFLEGLTCQETADALGLPLGTVLSRIHRGRAALRETLDHSNGRVVRIDDGARAQRRRP
jgi:RNA polymerase sigma-70 factor (ECF subfamily)